MSKTRLPRGQRKRPCIKLALELGWVPDGIGRSGHLRFLHPITGNKMTLPCSPSDWRSEKNDLCNVRRRTREEEQILATLGTGVGPTLARMKNRAHPCPTTKGKTA